MVTAYSQTDSDSKAITGTPDLPDDCNELAPCCVTTIEHHALHNPMMICTDCKQIIKCFSDEKAYRNYLIFCRSRRRKILTGKVGTYYTIIFRPYQTNNHR